MTYETILKVVRGEDGELYVETELKLEDVIGKKTNIVTLPLTKELGRNLIAYYERMIGFDIEEEKKELLRFVKEEIEEYLKAK
jgi:hypothetical protein